jgi:hypothetical protein
MDQDRVDMVEPLLEIIFEPVVGIIVDQAELGRRVDVVMFGRQRKDRPVYSVLVDGVDKDLEQGLDAFCCIGPVGQK